MNIILRWLLDLAKPYLFQIIIYGSVAAALGGGFLYLKVHYENVGYAKAISAIAAKDKSALDEVNNAKKMVDECYAAGRSWDVTSGLCD
ncbi:hypothetical protein AYJ54_00790 [Bradyrhizobium centrolobii]|uniref:Uncharacterized protein n=1 Tax=Bradyrhizobium centrolobii TaxID=1505087 RepID=A0A176YHU0_9BRAD|nr:hypothetical protein [Bradyrhizobium centrolobii]OAF05475.1 hypothetical protein AYJ54_00790 [Bradyrhizobium centrolobii]